MGQIMKLFCVRASVCLSALTLIWSHFFIDFNEKRRYKRKSVDVGVFRRG